VMLRFVPPGIFDNLACVYLKWVKLKISENGAPKGRNFHFLPDERRFEGTHGFMRDVNSSGGLVLPTYRLLTSSGAKTCMPKNSALNPAVLEPETLFKDMHFYKSMGLHVEKCLLSRRLVWNQQEGQIWVSLEPIGGTNIPTSFVDFPLALRTNGRT
jgi:hypothetical protein